MLDKSAFFALTNYDKIVFFFHFERSFESIMYTFTVPLPYTDIYTYIEYNHFLTLSDYTYQISIQFCHFKHKTRQDFFVQITDANNFFFFFVLLKHFV